MLVWSDSVVVVYGRAITPPLSVKPTKYEHGLALAHFVASGAVAMWNFDVQARQASPPVDSRLSETVQVPVVASVTAEAEAMFLPATMTCPSRSTAPVNLPFESWPQ